MFCPGFVRYVDFHKFWDFPFKGFYCLKSEYFVRGLGKKPKFECSVHFISVFLKIEWLVHIPDTRLWSSTLFVQQTLHIALYINQSNNQSINQSINQFLNQSINPILIRVYPRKWGWPDLPHSNGILSNSHFPSRSIQGILLLQTNTLALLLLLRLVLYSIHYFGFQTLILKNMTFSKYLCTRFPLRHVKKIQLKRCYRNETEQS